MTTRLIIMRHGAQDHSGRLTEEGRQKHRQSAERLKELGIKLDLILTSPLIRAVQSAEILAEVLPAPIVVETGLGEDFDQEIILALIPQNQTIALVGHMPTLADLAEKLAGAPLLPHGLHKSEAILLTFPDKIDWGKALIS